MTGDAVCIIPARGGSKRVPGKNRRDFAGMPLIAHPIGAAIESGCFSRIVVSTDDEKIAQIAKEHGAEVPFMREASLADDQTGTAEVVIDAIQRIGAETSDLVCCLYPTAPLVTPDDLTQSKMKISVSFADALVAVAEYDFAPLRAFKTADDGSLSFNWPEHALTRSQDLPELLHDAGAFYWVRTEPFLQSGKLIAEYTIGYQLPRWRVVDIDTEDDFKMAQMLFELVNRDGGVDAG